MTNRFFSFVTGMAIFLVLCCVPTSTLQAQEPVGQSPGPDALAILEALSTAGRELDYRGVFTYEYAGVLKSVEVTHIARDGVEHERWFYLNGPRQEVLRQGSFCMGVDGSLDRVIRPVVNQDQMSEHYDLQVWGEDRIADRPVWVLHLEPRDAYRYGFVFAVDQDSGLLLQSLLLDGNHRVLERFQYLLMDYGVDTEVARELMAATGARAGISGGERQRPAVSRGEDCSPPVVAASGSGWQTSWLPPGFRLMSRAVEAGDIESLLFSDGLAVFSVFLDPSDSERLPEVQAQRGATVAQLARVEAKGQSFLVSVVGEIPLETAQRVAGFVRHGGVE